MQQHSLAASSTILGHDQDEDTGANAVFSDSIRLLSLNAEAIEGNASIHDNGQEYEFFSQAGDVDSSRGFDADTLRSDTSHISMNDQVLLAEVDYNGDVKMVSEKDTIDDYEKLVSESFPSLSQQKAILKPDVARGQVVKKAAVWDPGQEKLRHTPIILAHNAGSGYLQNSETKATIADLTQCQKGHITKQLDCGARGLELRPYCFVDGKITFHHGATTELRKLIGQYASLIVSKDKMDLKKMITNELKPWLKKNPNEVVVLYFNNYQGEYDSGISSDQCKEKVIAELASHEIVLDQCLDGGLTSWNKKIEHIIRDQNNIVALDRECVDSNYEPSVHDKKVDKLRKYYDTSIETFEEQNLYWYPKILQMHWQYDAKSIAKMFTFGRGIIQRDRGSFKEGEVQYANIHDWAAKQIAKIPWSTFKELGVFVQMDDVCENGVQFTNHDGGDQKHQRQISQIKTLANAWKCWGLDSYTREKCICYPGSEDNGGKGVVHAEKNGKGVCGYHCSGSSGYCGDGGDYKGSDSIDCTRCR